jgi:hypothetical protein
VPASATAVVINVTVTNTTSNSYLTVWPTGSGQPTASNLNWNAGQTVANLVTVGLGSNANLQPPCNTNGCINFLNAGGVTDLIVDLEGYFTLTGASTAGELKAMSPARITDTRPDSGLPNANGTLGPGATLNIQVAGAGGVPVTGASAVVFNATVTNTTAFSWLTCWPTGQSMPTASNLNWTAGVTRANRVTIPLGTSGMVSCNNAGGKADLIIDVNAYYTDATLSGAQFVADNPSRILDTRNGTGGFFGQVGAGQTADVAVTNVGFGGPPVNAIAVVLNVTATNPTALSWLTVYPSLTSEPVASDLNFLAGQTVPNMTVVMVGSDGKVAVTNAGGSTDIIFDVVGYYG